MIGFLTAIATKTAISMFLQGAGAAITLLCTGSQIRRKRK